MARSFCLWAAKPGFLDFKAKAKWEAWTGQKGKSKEEAMQEYIKFALLLVIPLSLSTVLCSKVEELKLEYCSAPAPAT